MINNLVQIKADASNGPVFVTGIWKSGNHLVYSALNAMGVPGPYNGIAAHLLFGRQAWFKRLVRGPKNPADAVQIGLETDALVSRSYIAAQARRLSGKIMGGHAAYSPELEKVLQHEGARMICIRRDPRDILISFADWICRRADFYMYSDFALLSREQRIRFLLYGGRTKAGPLQPFVEVLRRGVGWLNSPNILQVSFEDLVGSSGGGDNAAQEVMLAAIHAHVGSVMPLDGVDVASVYGRSLTFNQGRIERWRELNDPDLLYEIENQLAPHLNDWGYSL